MSSSRFSLFEIAGLVGVFAGLLLVAYELRQNSIAAQAQTRATLTQIAHQMIESIATPEMIAITLKIRRDEALTEEEQLLLRLNINMQLRSGENVFYQHRIGTLSDEEFMGYRNFYKQSFADNPYWQQRWESQKTIFSPVFQAEIDSLIGEICSGL